MKKFTFRIASLIIIAVQSVLAQPYIPLNPKTEIDGNILFQDNEYFINERSRYFFRERAYPLGYIPDGVRERAWEQSKLLNVWNPHPGLSKANTSSASAWFVVGPSNVGGRITGIAIHPTNPDLIYFTPADGGIWKSTNGGATCIPVADDLPTMAMGSICIDPANTNIIYAGTGEANGSADSYPGVGVVKSVDGGNSWFLQSSKFASNIGKMLVSRVASNIVMAATRQGLYRSIDAGITWKQVKSGLAHDIIQHPQRGNVMFAAIQSIGVLRSNDTGATWTTMDLGVRSDSIGRLAIDLCLAQPDIMYCIIVSGKGSSAGLGVVKSTDGGTSWFRTLGATPNFFATYGWYLCDIAVHPTNPNKILSGGVGLYMSTDGGYTWQARTGIHVDQHAIEFSPTNPDRMYLGNDGGMYKSIDGGTSYSSLNNNLPITQFYELGITPQFTDIMMGGTQDNGTKQRKNTSTSWENATGGDGGYAVLDYSNLNYMYSEYQNGSHMRSTNGGSSFISANSGLYGSGLWVTPVTIHPTEPTILFTATTKQLYKTTNRGALWFPFHGNMDSTSSINYIAISPINPNIMFVGYTNGKIWKSTNAGAGWISVSSGLPNRTCKDIQFDPVDINTVYTSYSGYSSSNIYKTTDGGTTWKGISGNLPALPVNAIEINPNDPLNIFAGTDLGVYSTIDGGTTWDIVGSGMPKVVIADLELHPLNGVLYAATHGRSVFGLYVTTPVELTTFSAVQDGKRVLLHWRTGSESDNLGYSIERMQDTFGVWEDIGFVRGKGSTATLNLYDFSDNAIPLSASTLRYRLKQIDYNGSSTYSPIVEVQLSNTHPEAFVLEQNYPNPFNPVTTIRYSIPSLADVQLIVTDALGTQVAELVNTTQTAGRHVVAFDANALPTGSYFYHLIFDGKRYTKKMFVLK